jgi:hypothetical protein
VGLHLCIGAPYAYSVFNGHLTRQLGVVVPAVDDWTISEVIPVLSAVFVVQGVASALLGKWMENKTPKTNALLSALSFGGGFMIGGLGVYIHSLPMLYLGYGVLGGLGIALGYGM